MPRSFVIRPHTSSKSPKDSLEKKKSMKNRFAPVDFFPKEAYNSNALRIFLFYYFLLFFYGHWTSE